MATFTEMDQNYPSRDMQVRYVFVPVPIQAPTDFHPLPNAMDDIYHCPAPVLVPWEQLHADSFFPSAAPNNSDLAVIQSNIALALGIQASLEQGSSNAMSQPTYAPECYGTGTVNPESIMRATSSPDTISLDAYSGSIWAPSPTSAQQSPGSLGSPAMASNESYSPSSTPEVFSCSEPTCLETFPRRTGLKRHERRHRQNFRCELCPKAHADRRALHRHLESQHPQFAAQAGIKSEKTCCRKCDYVSRADNVRRHERSQHGLR